MIQQAFLIIANLATDLRQDMRGFFPQALRLALIIIVCAFVVFISGLSGVPTYLSYMLKMAVFVSLVSYLLVAMYDWHSLREKRREEEFNHIKTANKELFDRIQSVVTSTITNTVNH